MIAKKRIRDGPEYERRQQIGDWLVATTIRGTPFATLTIHQAVLSLTAGYGEYSMKRAQKALGISRDRSGRYRIRCPDEPKLPGTWDNNEYLKAFIVAHLLATTDAEKQKIVWLVYEYLGVPYTPLFTLPAKKAMAPRSIRHEEPIRVLPFVRTDVAPSLDQKKEPPRSERQPTARRFRLALATRPYYRENEIGRVREIIWGTIIMCYLPVLMTVLPTVFLMMGHTRKTTITATDQHPHLNHQTNPLNKEGKLQPPKAPPPEVTLRTTTLSYTLDSDDTLWGVARATLGKRTRKKAVLRYTKKIARTNTIRVPEWGISKGTRDARRLPPGLVIILPSLVPQHP